MTKCRLGNCWTVTVRLVCHLRLGTVRSACTIGSSFETWYHLRRVVSLPRVFEWMLQAVLSVILTKGRR